METHPNVLKVLVLGSGDMGSAVAYELIKSGYDVLIQDDRQAAHTRRGMSFFDALWEGQSELEGRIAKRVNHAVDLKTVWRAGCIAITDSTIESVMDWFAWDVLVDARMRKRLQPEDLRRKGQLTLGLGVSFEPKENCDIAIETSWEALGRIVLQGKTLPLRGEPKPINGVGRERYLYAPQAGTVVTEYQIGDLVAAGTLVLSIDDTPLYAPLSGALKGLPRSGVWVTQGTKVLEIEPRGEPALCVGLAERPTQVAKSVAKVCRDTTFI